MTRTLQVSQGSQGACLIGTLHQASQNGYQTRISLYCTSLQGHLIDTYSIQCLFISSQRSKASWGRYRSKACACCEKEEILVLAVRETEKKLCVLFHAISHSHIMLTGDPFDGP